MLKRLCNFRRGGGRGWTACTKIITNFYRILPRIKKHSKDLFFTFVTIKEDIHELTYRLAESGGIKRPTFIYLGTLFRVAYIVVFFYLSYANYSNLRYNQKFVSLSLNSGDCIVIPKLITIDNLKASYDGKWGTDRSFMHSYATYSFSLNNFQADYDQFDKWMKAINSEIALVGESAKLQSLPTNLLYWCFWYKDVPVPGIDEQQDEHVFQFSGSPNAIVNMDLLHGTISNRIDDCPTNSSFKSYDPTTGRYAIEFSIDGLSRSEKCDSVMTPSLFGYSEIVTKDKFRIELDYTSALSAIAVNSRIISISDLVFVSRYESFQYNNAEYFVDVMYFQEYSASDHIYCLGPRDDVSRETWLCLIKIGETFSVPYFDHFGTSETDPVKCDCSTSTGQSEACSKFDFLVGIFFYDYRKNTAVTGSTSPWHRKQMPIIPILELFFGSNAVSYKIFSESIFAASWMTATENTNNTVSRELYHDNSTYRDLVYSFSNTSFGTASLMNFRSYSLYDYRTINIDGFQLYNGSCSNSFDTPNFQNLINKPWGELVEPYYQCTYFPGDAFLNGVGIASGTVSTFLPTVVFLIMFAFIFPNVLKGTKYDPVSNARIDNFEYSLNHHDVLAMNLMSKLGKPSLHANVIVDGQLKLDRVKKKHGDDNGHTAHIGSPHIHSLFAHTASITPVTDVKNPNMVKGNTSDDRAMSSLSLGDRSDSLFVEDMDDNEMESKKIPSSSNDNNNDHINNNRNNNSNNSSPTKEALDKRDISSSDADKTNPKNSKYSAIPDKDDVESNFNGQNLSNTAKLDALASELKSSKAKIENAEVLLIQLKAEIRTLKSTVQRLESEIDSAIEG